MLKLENIKVAEYTFSKKDNARYVKEVANDPNLKRVFENLSSR